MSTDTRPQGKELTGRTVLICFLAFFGVVFAVNGVMIRAATSTFGGVETASAYKAGLAFKNELAAVRAQDALQWTVSAKLNRDASGDVTIDLMVADTAGLAPAGIEATARLSHPTDARLDQAVALHRASGTAFRGMASAPAGQWDLVIHIVRGDERVFRSRNRIVLR
jgi:nitrogen fixation protein FixH